MKRVVLALAIGLCALALPAPAPVAAAPEPAVVPPAGTWELTFKQHAPERFVTTVNGKQVTYWFMRYTVINNTGADQLFTPDFELLTDTGQSVIAYKNVDRGTFKKIKSLYNSKLMESPYEVLGKLLQGEDNARDGVAIWADVDPEARFFKIFVNGLSNETATVKNPLTGKNVTLVKSLELDYKIPGQQIDISPAPEFKGSKWVMKEAIKDPEEKAGNSDATSKPETSPAHRESPAEK